MTDIDALLDQLSDIVKPLVQEIEARPMTTQNHYGDYMGMIATVVRKLSANEGPSVYLGVGVAMQRAGANKQGVQAALRALGKL